MAKTRNERLEELLNKEQLLCLFMSQYAPPPTIHLIQTALDKNADINLKNQSTGFTPLHYAFTGPHKSSITKEIIKLLIDNKAKVNEKDSYGSTPLYYASQTSTWEIIELLIESNADLNLNSCVTDHTIYDSLFRLSKINFSKENIQFLVKHGADFNHQFNYNGQTLLHRCFNNNESTPPKELLEHLIKYKPDVNIADEEGNTAFHFAARRAPWEMINFLIENGADVESLKNNSSNDNLFLKNSNIEWDEEKLDFLSKKGLDIYFQKSFDSSQYYNLSFENLKIFEQKLFIDSQKNGSTFSREILSKKIDNFEKIKYLVEKNLHKTQNILHQIIVLKYDLSLIKYLVENKANINEIDTYSCPFSSASTNKDLELVKYLVEHKAEIDLESLNEYDLMISPLMHCMYQNTYQDNTGFEIIKFLVENKANINSQGPSLNTPLHIATTKIKYIMEKPKEGKEFLKYMIKNNADVNFENNEGKTPFSKRSEIEQNIELIKPLLECHRDEFNKIVTPTFLMSLKIWTSTNLKTIFPKPIKHLILSKIFADYQGPYLKEGDNFLDFCENKYDNYIIIYNESNKELDGPIKMSIIEIENMGNTDPE